MRLDTMICRGPRYCTASPSLKLFHILDHPFALFGIGQPPAPGAEIVDHMLGFAGAGNGGGDRRMAENEFQEELAPACAIELGRPVRQLPAQRRAEQPSAAERP